MDTRVQGSLSPSDKAANSASISQISSGCTLWKFGLCHSTSAESANFICISRHGKSSPPTPLGVSRQARNDSARNGAHWRIISRRCAGDRAAILAALHRYVSAIAAGDWGAACGQLSAPIKHQLELLLAHAKGVHGRGCAAALGALFAHTPGSLRRQLTPLNVIAVRINSNRAFVLYRSTQLPHAVISMLREAGRWKAGVLAGSNAG